MPASVWNINNAMAGADTMPWVQAFKMVAKPAMEKAFMFAVCMVMGIAPVTPKRKKQLEIEVKMVDNKKEIDTKETFSLNKADG